MMQVEGPRILAEYLWIRWMYLRGKLRKYITYGIILDGYDVSMMHVDEPFNNRTNKIQ